MTHVHIEYSGHKLDFATARHLAMTQALACDMAEPAVLSWYQNSTHRFSPGFAGAREAPLVGEIRRGQRRPGQSRCRR